MVLSDAFGYCGYRNPGQAWYDCYQYSVNLNGRWEPLKYIVDGGETIINSRLIQESAMELATDLFCQKVWVEENEAEIVVSYST